MSSKTRITPLGFRHAAAQARTPEGSAIAVASSDVAAIVARAAIAVCAVAPEASRSLAITEAMEVAAAANLKIRDLAELQHEVSMLAAFGRLLPRLRAAAIPRPSRRARR